MRARGLGPVGWALALGLAGPGLAATPAKPASDWVSMPSATEFAASRAAAREAGVFARAVVRCDVADDGALTACRVMRETPLDSGFAAKLLALAPKFRRTPPGADGLRQIDIVNSWSPMDKPGDWLKRPTEADLLEVFPAEAAKRGISGHALISCVSTVQGALTECVTLDESPAGLGFGGAAIALTPQFLMKPATQAGKPVVAMVNIPVSFAFKGGPMPVGDAKKVFPANVAWAEAPTFTDVAAAYPKKARAEGKPGRVTLTCDMTDAGRLANCLVATSEPFGYGFDTAAKSLARRFSFSVSSEADKKAVRDITVHLPITFDPATLDAATPVVGKPTWTGIPTEAQLTAAFAEVKPSGPVRVILSCKVEGGGRLSGCVVDSETPAGAGIGAAALTLAPAIRLSTWTSEGLPVIGGTVRIPIRYDPAPAAAASPPPAGH